MNEKAKDKMQRRTFHLPNSLYTEARAQAQRLGGKWTQGRVLRRAIEIGLKRIRNLKAS